MPHGYFEPKQLVCTHCNYDGTTCPDAGSNRFGCPAHDCECVPFLWMEDDPIQYRIMGVIPRSGERGWVIMDDDGMHDSDQHSPRIYCCSCAKEFPVPAHLCGDWGAVDYYAELLSGMAQARAAKLYDHGAVVFLRPLDRYPHASIKAGATGRVTELMVGIVSVTLDHHEPGLAEWDNALVFNLEDIEDCHDLLRSVAIKP